MKITKREQLLVGVLLLALLGYGYYNFIYIKQAQKITELKASRDIYSQKWELAKVKMVSKDKRKEQYKVLNDKISNETDMLFPSIEQERIIVVLDKMIKDSNLQADSLAFSEVSSEETPVETSKTAETEEKSKKVTDELDKLVSDFNNDSKKAVSSKAIVNTNSSFIGAYKMQVTFNFKGIYDELISFIDQVESYDKKITIDNIKLIGSEGSDVSGTIILEFYGIPKLDDNKFFVWDYKKPSGIGNPFVGSSTSLQVNNKVLANNVVKENSGVTNTNEIVTKKVEYEVKDDFIMTAKPITSDLHTVTIEKSKDESNLSYIYADNAGIEAVEFYFTKTGSTYFYKYKTSIETYPKNFNNSIEYVPNAENIILDIVSQKRGLGSDLSGVNIKITNDTDKSVVVNILDDDKIKPRVNIVKEKGDISVNRNYIYYTDK